MGVVRERGRTADDRVIKTELHPHHWGWALGDRPSIQATANNLVFQELAAAHTQYAYGRVLGLGLYSELALTIS